MNSHGKKSVYRELSYNAKTDVIFSAAFEYIPKNFQNVKRFWNKNSVMVWTAEANNGTFNSKFKNKKISMNDEYCILK